MTLCEANSTSMDWGVSLSRARHGVSFSSRRAVGAIHGMRSAGALQRWPAAVRSIRAELETVYQQVIAGTACQRTLGTLGLAKIVKAGPLLPQVSIAGRPRVCRSDRQPGRGWADSRVMMRHYQAAG